MSRMRFKDEKTDDEHGTCSWYVSGL